MSNPRDTGRYDAFNDEYVDQQVRVDFAWGNIPMQPNDDRETHLDPELDSHIIATASYQGFPSFLRGEPYDDTIANAVMPDLTGLTLQQADDALAAVGINTFNQNSTANGATTVNNGKVSSQFPAAGTILNVEEVPAVVLYNAPEVPNVVGLTEAAATTALTNAGLVKGTVTTADNAAGATSGNNGTIKTQTPASGTTVNSGSSVDLVKYAYTAVVTTGPIHAIQYDAGLTAGDYKMYLLGQTIKPTVGWSINISGSTAAAYNTDWQVISVENDNAYNTGGTKVIIRNITVTETTLGTIGTWTKNA